MKHLPPGFFNFGQSVFKHLSRFRPYSTSVFCGQRGIRGTLSRQWINLIVFKTAILCACGNESFTFPPGNVLNNQVAKTANILNASLISFQQRDIIAGVNMAGDISYFAAKLELPRGGCLIQFKVVTRDNSEQAAGGSQKGRISWSDIHTLGLLGLISFLIGLAVGYFLTPSHDNKDNEHF